MTKSLRNVMYLSGILAIVLYVLHVIIGGFLWEGYSHLHQPISDLTASGAPNKVLMSLITLIYGILAIIFALSFTVFESRKQHKFVFWGGISFIVLHIISISYGLFPQDLPNTETTFFGIIHIVITALIVPFTILTPILVGLGFIKEPVWKTFGIYSIITGILIILLGGASGYFFVEKLPYFGLIERLNIGTLQLWTFLLSIKLITIK